MHDTAREHGRLFFQLYVDAEARTVVELGSQDVNGALRDQCPPGPHYIGVDVMAAKGVDVLVDPAQTLPLADACADAVVTSSAFEHDPAFWQTFLELLRILRPGGFLYLNAPSNGGCHRYPVDCWRFYPDAGIALVRWAARSGIPLELAESFIGEPMAEGWADFVAVFRKTDGSPLRRKGRIADHVSAKNIHDVDGRDDALGAATEETWEMRTITLLRHDLAGAEAARDDAASERDAVQRDLEAAVARSVALERELSIIRGSRTWRARTWLCGLLGTPAR